MPSVLDSFSAVNASYPVLLVIGLLVLVVLILTVWAVAKAVSARSAAKD